MAAEPIAYCREIESYLCQKNDGHLIRVVGPSFELVSKWAAEGVPLKVAFEGIDRYFARYYRQGPRRRPVRIDFCEADVYDAFEEWRRAIGLTSTGDSREAQGTSASLPAHLERVLARLTALNTRSDNPALGDILDRVSAELDRARESARGMRGAARQALLDRLRALDQELLTVGRGLLDETTRLALEHEADSELADYHERMAHDAFARAREAAVDALVRRHLGLPTLVFT